MNNFNLQKVGRVCMGLDADLIVDQVKQYLNSIKINDDGANCTLMINLNGMNSVLTKFVYIYIYIYIYCLP